MRDTTSGPVLARLAGTQWHPEKPPYEFGMEEVPHSLDAIRVSQHLSNVFMENARQSSHKPESKEEELAMQIYSTAPIFSARFEVRVSCSGVT
jgi:gamma-glutamyl hydrolase